MTDALTNFQDHLLARRVARRVMGFEHPTEEARKKYLKDHPGAKPSDHRVKKQESKAPAKDDKPKGEGTKQEPKGEGSKSEAIVAKNKTKLQRQEFKVDKGVESFRRAVKSLSKTGDYKYRGDRKEGKKKALANMEKFRDKVVADGRKGLSDLANVISEMHSTKEHGNYTSFLLESFQKAEAAFKKLTDHKITDNPTAGSTAQGLVDDFQDAYTHLSKATWVGPGKR